MGSGCHQFGDGVSQCGIGAYIEYRIDILSLFYASFIENNRYEVHTRAIE
jgi:hypothetical protein